ncbi:PAS domain-containing sensor histidine kinase [Psychroflexus sp. ALD_RP9]|uniref:PAS domain-containing sensor histidine kinase n=1 Tax=Psychroflexus sp. ALD_RP9 TaxID=2777186 RepID=UPI001AF9DEC4|nr:PAS domain-containing sensor histidine kinase [Psychroflexus sp. ALD_RP9]QSS97690.1 PAS domain S-box protein [Psychroflexus sp. ALD_RP9]
MNNNKISKDIEVFKLLFEGISEGVLVVDTKQIIIEVNTSAAEMFGYSKAELIGKKLDILIPQKYHHNHHKHVDQFMNKSKKRQMGIGRDLYGVKKNGVEFPVEAGLNPFEFDGERYVMSLITDITLRKKNEEEIEQLNVELEAKVKSRTKELQFSIEELTKLNKTLEKEIKKRKIAEAKTKDALQKERELNDLKTKFLSLVSHEFKTPLSGILTSTTLIGKYTEKEQQEKREKHLKTIKNKVHYLTGILNDFLSVERLESGKVTYKFEEFSLVNLINEVVYSANITLKDGQDLHYPKQIQDFILRQDKNVLELILSNLLNNAIKYSPEHTDIYFNIDNTDPKLIKFEVKDQGMGIPKKDHKHIFERYFRAENALLNQGTGIGLNIVKVHLENLNGHIRFESEENQGTSFFVEIPKRHE